VIEPKYQSDKVTLYLGDCLEILPQLEPGSVDAILTDIPYGTTACAWDEIIPFDPMWIEVKRLLKQRGVFVTTASQPFTSKLVMSNLEWFRVSWYWRKERGTNFQTTKYYPMKVIEECLVFSKNGFTYNPQKTPTKRYRHIMPIPKDNHSQHMSSSGIDNNGKRIYREYSELLPENILTFTRDGMSKENSLHPTQKPTSLYSYFIRTYTNADNLVLDFTMGSGTTGVACMQTGRKFIGIEIDPNYYAIAEKRIRAAEAQLLLGI